MVTQSDLTTAYASHRWDIISTLVAYHGVSIADAEDCLQDVVLRTLEKWEVCHDTLKNWVSADLPHFLFIAALNRCKDVSIKNSKRFIREQLYFGGYA